MHRLSEVVTEESGKLLTLRFKFDPTIEKLEPKTISVTLSSDMNMFEVGLHLNKAAAIILGHHEEAEKIRNKR